MAEGGDLVFIYSWHWRYGEDLYDDLLGRLWVNSGSRFVYDHLSSDDGNSMVYLILGP